MESGLEPSLESGLKSMLSLHRLVLTRKPLARMKHRAIWKDNLAFSPLRSLAATIDSATMRALLADLT